MGYDPDRTDYPADRGKRLCMDCGDVIDESEATTDEHGQTVCEGCGRCE